jgi:purine nucleoside permease
MAHGLRHADLATTTETPMPRTLLASLAAASIGLLIAGQARAQDAIIVATGARLPVHVVVVNTFEIPGSTPGERQEWLHRFPFTQQIAFPQGYAPLYYNPDRKVLDIETGEGPVHMASSIEALANDPRFDFTDAYWLLAGIAGIDPNVGPAGSVAWASYVVDGDLAYEIDAREIPSDWSTGYVPLGRTAPYQQPRPKVSSLNGTSLFRLNARLAKWAWQFSNSKVTLPDDSNLQQLRAEYTSFPATQSPPKILQGDVLAAGTFWIGALLNTWAENWVNYWSNGKAVFTMTSEEDAGYMQALTFLAQNHQVDLDRVFDLRGASDFSVPPPGTTAAQLLAQDATGTGYSAFFESLDDVYLAGSSVAYELTNYWSYYSSHIPGSIP